LSLDPIAFPADFLWGASTAAHQIEGNNVNNDWWEREHAPGSSIAEPSGDACDSYHRYREDMALLAELGFDSYRFSLEWSRIEPEQGFFSRAEIDHYRRMAATCHEVGLTPILTLHHFTVPRWMAALGGWANPQAPDLFARYTETILPIIAEGVEWVCTINEPNMIALMAGTGGDSNIVTREPDRYISEQLVRAHQSSRTVLSSVAGVKSGWAVATLAFHAEPGCEKVAQDYAYPREDYFLEAAGGDDYIGVQAYTRTIIGRDGPRPVPEGAETTLTGWEYFPQAAAIGVRNAWKLAGHIPVVVTENGIATSDDTRRIAYTQAALTELHHTITEGVDLRGYLHWSALDNYEWGSYAPTFGLIAVDRQTFTRTPKPSAHWLGQVAKTGGLPFHATR
jgi:beta-glucosidase